MELLILIAIIVGGFAIVNYGEKEKRIRIHGYDWKKPDSQRTQSECDFITKKRQDEEIMKEFNYIQQGLKLHEHDIKVYIAENGMTQEAINQMNTCLMSLDFFQELATKLPVSLGGELMNAAKAETVARARRKVAKNSFYGLNEVEEIHKHKATFEKLFVVMGKCREYNDGKNVSTAIDTKSGSSSSNYEMPSRDIFR